MKKKYLEKKVDEKDSRAYLIGLTLQAREMMSGIENMSLEVTKESLNGLSQQEVKVFYKALNKIIENLSGGE